MRLNELDCDLVDDLVSAVLLDGRLDRLALIRLDVLRRQRLANKLQSLVDGVLVGRRAVLPQQKLDDKGRNPERRAHPSQQVLAHHEAGEGFIREVI